MQPTEFTNPLTALVAEMFGVSGTPYGYVLDDGKSGLLPTLETVTAEQASTALSAEHATIASHAAHVLFLLQIFHRTAMSEQFQPDWGDAWSHRILNASRWDALRGELQTAFETAQNDIRQNPVWNEDRVGGALSLLAHVSYHFGEIRQMRTTLLARE